MARIAIERMSLRAGDIGITPGADAGAVGAVGLPTWMWIDSPGPATWGPMTQVASAAGTTVTATARAASTVWDMGDGATVICTTPGTPYDDRFGLTESPDCGHRYSRTSASQPGGVYTVTVTTNWTADWTSTSGATGSIPLSLSRSATVRIGEIQVLND
ncbi:MAG: ATP/GTP-binding protein [Kineosporiaceae bacterium]